MTELDLKDQRYIVLVLPTCCNILNCQVVNAVYVCKTFRRVKTENFDYIVADDHFKLKLLKRGYRTLRHYFKANLERLSSYRFFCYKSLFNLY